MPLLPNQAIDEFQALWKKHYGVELPRSKANAQAHQFFMLVQMLADSPHSPKPSDSGDPNTDYSSQPP